MENTFKQFREDIESGKEIINESEYSAGTIRSLINQVTYQLDQMRPSMSQVYSAVQYGPIVAINSPVKTEKVDELKTMADDPVFAAKYEKIVACYAAAQLAYLRELNKGLKSIK
jgi:hypothetical protein